MEPNIALLNHSCEPNADVIFDGSDVRVRSRRTIEPGEEITISYVDPNESFEVRRDHLLSKFYFECRCNKCQKEASGLTELKTGDAKLDREVQQTQRFLRSLAYLDYDQIPIGCIEADIIRICHNGYLGKPWPCTIQPLPNLIKALAVHYQYRNTLKSYGLWLKVCFECDPILWPNRYSVRRVENFMKYVGMEG